MATETKIIDEFIVKNSNRFRNDHGHKALKRLRVCIGRYEELNLLIKAKTLEDAFPPIAFILKDNEVIKKEKPFYST